MYVVVSVVTGLYGSVDLWTAEYSVFGEKRKLFDIFRIMLNFGMPLLAVVSFKNIYLKFNTEHTQKLWSTPHFIAQILYWLISFMTFNLAMNYSVCEIWKTNNVAMQLGHGL